MMWIFKTAFALLALILLAFGGLSLYGLSLPERHHASVSVELKASQVKVWDLLADFEAYPGWWSQVKSVKLGKTADGRPVAWQEDENGQRVGYLTLEQKRPKTLVRQVFDPGRKLGWDGTWTLTLERVGKGKAARTKLTVTEDGGIQNPFFRVLAAKAFGFDRNLKNFTAAVEAEIARQTK